MTYFTDIPRSGLGARDRALPMTGPQRSENTHTAAGARVVMIAEAA